MAFPPAPMKSCSVPWSPVARKPAGARYSGTWSWEMPTRWTRGLAFREQLEREEIDLRILARHETEAQIAPMRGGDAANSYPHGIDVRLVSWNIQHGGGARVAQLAERIAAWNPDCLVLCEFRGTPPSRKLADQLRLQGLVHQVDTVDAGSPATNGILIAGRYELTPRPQGRLAGTSRWLPVRVAGPLPLTLVGFHVPNRDSGIKYEFHEHVVSELTASRDEVGLAVGDSNTGRRGLDEETAFFNAQEDAWFDRLSAAGWHDAFRVRNPAARVYSWRSTQGNGFRLDQAFLTEPTMKALRSIRYDWAGPNPPSDHAALLVELNADS